jgi:hypothetical protein
LAVRPIGDAESGLKKEPQRVSLFYSFSTAATPPPEGDMSIAEARTAWPEKFFWMHPPLGWFREEPQVLTSRIEQMFKDAGSRLACLMISEDIPPDAMNTIPTVLASLQRRSILSRL